MTRQPYRLNLDVNWQPSRPPSPFTDDDMLTCSVHGEWSPNAYYTAREINEMLDEQDCVSCPLCLAEIVGIE